MLYQIAMYVIIYQELQISVSYDMSCYFLPALNAGRKYARAFKLEMPVQMALGLIPRVIDDPDIYTDTYNFDNNQYFSIISHNFFAVISSAKLVVDGFWKVLRLAKVLLAITLGTYNSQNHITVYLTLPSGRYLRLTNKFSKKSLIFTHLLLHPESKLLITLFLTDTYFKNFNRYT